MGAGQACWEDWRACHANEGEPARAPLDLLQNCCAPTTAGCSEVHGTFKRSVPSAMTWRHPSVTFGADDWTQWVTDSAAVQRVKQQLSSTSTDGSME